MNSFFTAWSPRVLSVLRLIAGFLMLWHGSQKLFNFPASASGPQSDPVMLFAGVLEFFGGLLLVIGLFTRPAAFLMSGLMAVAYFMAHAPAGFLPLSNGGELAVIYSFLYLYLFFAGGGAWSVDALLAKQVGGQTMSAETA